MTGEEREAGAAALLPRGEKLLAQQADEGSAVGTSTPCAALRAIYFPERRRIARLAIGVGFRTRCSAEALAGLVDEALRSFAETHPDLAAAPAVLATIAEKDRPALHAAALLLGLDIVVLPKAALADTDDRITVASERVRACLGIPSVAEAAALAAAGPGSRLVVTRIATGDATCAIALSAEP